MKEQHSIGREVVDTRKTNLMISGCHLSVWVFGYLVYSVVTWFWEGHWPKGAWIFFWIIIGALVVELLESHMQTVHVSVLEVREAINELAEKIDGIDERLEQMESTLDDVDRRVPGRKSLLDEY